MHLTARQKLEKLSSKTIARDTVGIKHEICMGTAPGDKARQVHRRTGTAGGKQAADRQTDPQTDRPTDRRTDADRDKHTEGQI